jgi:hypothetical protein
MPADRLKPSLLANAESSRAPPAECLVAAAESRLVSAERTATGIHLPTPAESRLVSARRMPGGTRRRRSLAELAERQHGVIARRQLAALGFSDAAVARLVGDGFLCRKVHGVYAVGHPTLTRHGWWMVAVLAGGEDSVLSHRAAAALFELLPGRSLIDIIVPRHSADDLPGIRAHRCVLRPSDVVIHHGVPVTGVARTLLDLAGSEPPERLAEALDAALMLELYDHAEMVQVLARYPRRRGVRSLRLALSRLGDEPERFRSRSERRARDLIVAAGLPAPEINAWYPTVAGHGFELDLFWRGRQRNLEIDGPRHDQPFQRSKDRFRDADLRGRGIAVKRVPVAELDADAVAFVAGVAQFLLDT